MHGSETCFFEYCGMELKNLLYEGLGMEHLIYEGTGMKTCLMAAWSLYWQRDKNKTLGF